MTTKYNKWVNHFEVIKTEVRDLCHHRFLFLELQRIISENSDLHIESAIWDFLNTSYASYATVAVRRLIKPQGQSISFVGILADMAENPKELTVETYKSLYKDSAVAFLAESEFQKYSDSSGKILNSDMVKADLETLKTVSQKIEDFADKRVAHRDKRDVPNPPTFNELNECISEIERLTCKYQLILLAISSDTMTPYIIDDWQAVFRMPWIKAG